jgi:hypothetical protein
MPKGQYDRSNAKAWGTNRKNGKKVNGMKKRNTRIATKSSKVTPEPEYQEEETTTQQQEAQNGQQGIHIDHKRALLLRPMVEKELREVNAKRKELEELLESME